MRFALITAVAISTGILVGCKDEQTTTPPAKPATQATTQPSLGDTLRQGAENAAAGTRDLATKATDATRDAADKVKEGTQDAVDKTKEGASNAADKVKDATSDATTGADAGMAAKVKEQAQKYYDQAMEAVKKKDFSAADSALEQLEKIKTQLSPEWQSKVDSLKSAIETAKKTDVKLPGTGE